MSTNSKSRIFLISFCGTEPDGRWKALTGAAVGSIAGLVAGAGAGGTRDAAAAGTLALGPPNEKVGIPDKAVGWGVVPSTGVVTKLPGFGAVDPEGSGRVGMGMPPARPLAVPPAVPSISETVVSPVLVPACPWVLEEISCSIHCCCSWVKIGGGDCVPAAGCPSSAAMFSDSVDKDRYFSLE